MNYFCTDIIRYSQESPYLLALPLKLQDTGFELCDGLRSIVIPTHLYNVIKEQEYGKNIED